MQRVVVAGERLAQRAVEREVHRAGQRHDAAVGAALAAQPVHQHRGLARPFLADDVEVRILRHHAARPFLQEGLVGVAPGVHAQARQAGVLDPPDRVLDLVQWPGTGCAGSCRACSGRTSRRCRLRVRARRIRVARGGARVLRLHELAVEADPVGRRACRASTSARSRCGSSTTSMDHADALAARRVPPCGGSPRWCRSAGRSCRCRWPRSRGTSTSAACSRCSGVGHSIGHAQVVEVVEVVDDALDVAAVAAGLVVARASPRRRSPARCRWPGCRWRSGRAPG